MRVTDLELIATYYKALLERKSEFVGVFFVGVKTTSVFCIATCRARKPKRENVEFYTDFKDALMQGYRPCKVCNPTAYATTVPEQVRQAIRLVKEHPGIRYSDKELKKLQLSPDILRRWFKKNYGMTFHEYQRMYRINDALLELKNGKTTTATAFDSGYDSLSGFGYTFKKLIGASPQKHKANSFLCIDRVTTPLGPMLIGATEKGICFLEFVNKKELSSLLDSLQVQHKANIMVGTNFHIQRAKYELQEYFEGRRTTFTVQLHTVGTAVRKEIWTKLQTIGFGESLTLQQFIKAYVDGTSVAEVIEAIQSNTIFILIPCHRIQGATKALEHDHLGWERKKWLCRHEKKYI